MIADRLLSLFVDRYQGRRQPANRGRFETDSSSTVHPMAQRRAIYPTLDEARASFRMNAPAPSEKMGTGSRTPDDEIPQSVHRRRTTRRPTAMQLLQSTGDGSRGIQLPRQMTREPVLQNRQGRSCLAAPSQEQGAGKTAELSDTSAANSLEILIARRSVSIQLHPQYRL